MWAMAIYSLDARPGIDAGHTLHCSPQQHLGAEVSTPKQWKQLPFWWPKSKDSYAKYDDLWWILDGFIVGQLDLSQLGQVSFSDRGFFENCHPISRSIPNFTNLKWGDYGIGFKRFTMFTSLIIFNTWLWSDQMGWLSPALMLPKTGTRGPPRSRANWYIAGIASTYTEESTAQ